MNRTRIAGYRCLVFAPAAKLLLLYSLASTVFSASPSLKICE